MRQRGGRARHGRHEFGQDLRVEVVPVTAVSDFQSKESTRPILPA
jgi:hypothetical protein